jgi:hypothetical protein
VDGDRTLTSAAAVSQAVVPGLHGSPVHTVIYRDAS